MTLSDILILKFPEADFVKDIILQDDGNGVYIKEWNIEEPIPTKEDLQLWEQELDLPYRQNQVRRIRATLYPSWQEQMDMQYHDQKDNTTIWVDSINAIKLANPIPH